MKRVQFTRFGPPTEVATIVDGPDVGAPSAWEAVVQVEAFPINPSDLAMLAGRYGKLPTLPAPIGMEAVGRIVERGASVTNFAVGDRVVLLGNDNWAERRKIAVSALQKIPADGDLLQYAMLKVNPSTDRLMLEEASLAPGDFVLTTAPLSGVGCCLLQIARARGLRTVSLVRSDDARNRVLAAGGDVAVEMGPDLAARVRKAVAGRPIKLALDAVAGAGVDQLAQCLADGGKIVVYGMLSGEPAMLGAEHIVFRGISLQGFWASKVLNRLSLAERQDHYGSLSELIAQGRLRMPIDATFPFSQIREAIRRAEQSGRRGKVLVTVGEAPK